MEFNHFDDDVVGHDASLGAPEEFTNILMANEDQMPHLNQQLLSSMSDMSVQDSNGSSFPMDGGSWIHQYAEPNETDATNTDVTTAPPQRQHPQTQYTYPPAISRPPLTSAPTSGPQEPAQESRRRGSSSPREMEKKETKRSSSRERAQHYSPYPARARSASPTARRSPSPQRRPPSPSPHQSPNPTSPAPVYPGTAIHSAASSPSTPLSGGVRRVQGIRRINSEGAEGLILEPESPASIANIANADIKVEAPQALPGPGQRGADDKDKVPPPARRQNADDSSLRIVSSVEGGYRLIIPQEALQGLTAGGQDVSVLLPQGNAAGGVAANQPTTVELAAKPGIRQSPSKSSPAAAAAEAVAGAASTAPETVKPPEVPSKVLPAVTAVEAASPPAKPPTKGKANPNRPKNYKCSKCGQPKKGHVCQFGMNDRPPLHPGMGTPQQMQLLMQQQQTIIAMGQQMGLFMSQQQQQQGAAPAVMSNQMANAFAQLPGLLPPGAQIGQLPTAAPVPQQTPGSQKTTSDTIPNTGSQLSPSGQNPQ